MPKLKTQAKSKNQAAVDQDIVGLITTLVQKLVSLESKIDIVIRQTSPRSFETPRQQPMPIPSTVQTRDARPMYKAVCADCRKACEVPFKPSGDRPVYCKECFAKRKASKPFSAKTDIKPQAAPAPRAPAVEKPQPAAVKRSKPVQKKKLAKKRRKK